MTSTNTTVSIIIPAKNESAGLGALLPSLKSQHPETEIIVVDDGSTDETVAICKSNNCTVISHPYSIGNGGAIKTGARFASGDILVFMDADGQHNPDDVSRLVEKLADGYEMVIGARELNTHASLFRRLANGFYNRFASIMTGKKIKDLTSGFRAVRARHFRRFLYLLPNGFSYPTTSTMAFFRSGLPVAYIPIRAAKREGVSKIRIFKDGTRFLLIIIKIGSLFSPMRLFLPVSLLLFLLGAGYYAFTFITEHRFTNMSALLFIASTYTFLMGILSEQISALHYKDSSLDQRRVIRDKNS